MITPELITFIKQQLAAGMTHEQISQTLQSNGWTTADVSDAFVQLNSPYVTPTAPAMPIMQPTAPVMAQPATQYQQPVGVMTQGTVPPRKKIGWMIAIIALIVLIGGGGAYAYFAGYFSPLETITTSAFDAARNATSAEFDTTITVDASALAPTGNEAMQLLPGDIFSKESRVTLKGSYDISDPKSPKGQGELSVSFGAIKGSAELRVLDRTLYGQLIQAPTIALIPMISQYEKKWFSFPLGSGDGDVSPISLASIPGIDAGIINDLSDDQKDRLLAITKSAHFIQVTERLAPETVGGEFSYHFKFILDREGIQNYFDDVKNYLSEVGKDDSRISSLDPEIFNESLDKIQDFTGEAWIGQKDHLPHKVAVDFNIVAGDDDTKVIKMGIVSIWSDWNQPIDVQAPEGSVTFEEFINSPEGPLADSRSKAQEAMVKSVLSSTRPSAELFYDSHNYSYSGVCSSQEFLYFKSRVQNDAAPTATQFTCGSTKTTYVAFVKLASGGYYCADATGFAGNISKQPTGTTCAS